jgi:hypothetical protein
MTPYIQQWSLDVQHELFKGLLLDVGYFGSKGTHLLGIVDLNLVAPGVAQAAGLVKPGEQVVAATTPKLTAVRPYKGYVAINAPQYWFNSSYHSLQMQIEKRFSHGSLISASYTWSHNMTDNQSDRSNAPQNPTTSIPNAARRRLIGDTFCRSTMSTSCRSSGSSRESSAAFSEGGSVRNHELLVWPATDGADQRYRSAHSDLDRARPALVPMI